MTDDNLESRLLDFEEAWRREEPPEIADFLGSSSGLDSPDRRRLLLELIAIDLEFRWRSVVHNPTSRRTSRAGGLCRDVSRAGALGRLPLELIGEEYRVLCRWGRRPSHADVMGRFPAHPEEVLAELLAIDCELAEEEADPRSRGHPGVTTSRPEARSAAELDGLCSHRDLRLQRLIGAGRMGKVYLAWHHTIGGPCAVKFLRKMLLQESEIVRRFIGEAQTVAALIHPHIVGIHAVGRTPAGSYFLVMDLVDGPDLAQVARTRPITVGEALCWSIEACLALEHAHQKGVIHCDLKPANLLLGASGRIRVADFGLARSLRGPTPWAAEIEGTAPFMAPEQASPWWGRIDQRTDVYGIGSVLFTLLAGRPPHIGRRLPDILTDVIGPVPVVSLNELRPDLPEPIGEVCRKCLAKPPEERFQTIREVREVLASLS